MMRESRTRATTITTALAALLATAAGAAPARAQRLPDTVRPERYTLWFAPNLQTETFRGRATIQVQLLQPSSTVTLNAAELAFGAVSIEAGGRTQAAAVTLDPTAQTATLTVPDRIPAGAATVTLSYTGTLNDDLRGFYISKANGRKYAISQMEATDARRAFPSFDEPAYKATFDISLQIDRADTAISNGAPIADTPGPEPGTHTMTFATTPKMSTYLVALLVGDFVCRSGTSEGTAIRVCATPDKRELTGFALEATSRLLKFYNGYFGIRYPFGKLDIIGVPDFSAGAMENAGAITFRERLLLVDPARASSDVRKNVAGIIAHELAHQWFGNLVTMRWWDDIWLNEGFASWLASKPLQAWHPEWRVDLDDVGDTQDTLATDALRTTRAIRTRAETPTEIEALFDSIAYGKTAAVLRMLESYVGANRFRDGIRAYLRKYSWSNATGEDFWNEMTRVTGRPVDTILRSFVDQPGAPLLTVGDACTAGAPQLEISQGPVLPAAPGDGAYRWTVPACVRPVPGKAACQLIDRPKQNVPVRSCTAVANAGGRGYFLTEYSAAHVLALGTQASHLTASERITLLGDEWWTIRAGRHDVGVYLDLVPAFARDTTPAIASALAERLTFIGGELVEPAGRPAFERWLRTQFMREPATTAARASRDEASVSRQATLLLLLGVVGNDTAAQREATAMAARYLDGNAVPPGIVDAALQVAATTGDAALHDRYVAHLARTTSQPDDYFRVLDALTWFRDPALVTRTLQLALSEQIRSQDITTLIGGTMARPWARELAWEFVKREWPRLVQRLGTFQSLPRIVSSLAAFCSADRAADIRQFFATTTLPGPARGLQQALERIETCDSLRQRQRPALARWLAAH